MSTASRKLAAILSADVAGYSRLMGEDEQGTLSTLTEYRSVMSGLIGQHRGRVIDAPGDALLAEFPSAVEAVQCAVEIQQELSQRNAQLSEPRRMLFRIGVNLGDVIEQDAALYGDGVNIAARLESLAKPGGICVSGTVFDQVDGKVTATFRFGGEQTVKNIARPLRTYHVQGHGEITAPLRGRRKPRAAFASLAVGLTIVAVLAWQLQDDTTQDRTLPVPQLHMPSSAGLAVLPFSNMSGDAGQEYFSDGLTEDIITELARFLDIKVLARNTTFQYNGQSVDVAAIGRKFGARYVLEGSVRRAGNRVRITAQLIDVTDGSHLWAERYDREVEDILLVQSEIASKIVSTIAGGARAVLPRISRARLQRADESGVNAYDLALQARVLANQWTKESHLQARHLLERAMALDPGYAGPKHQYAYLMLMGWIARIDPSLARRRK